MDATRECSPLGVYVCSVGLCVSLSMTPYLSPQMRLWVVPCLCVSVFVVSVSSSAHVCLCSSEVSSCRGGPSRVTPGVDEQETICAFPTLRLSSLCPFFSHSLVPPPRPPPALVVPSQAPRMDGVKGQLRITGQQLGELKMAGGGDKVGVEWGLWAPGEAENTIPGPWEG